MPYQSAHALHRPSSESSVSPTSRNTGADHDRAPPRDARELARDVDARPVSSPYSTAWHRLHRRVRHRPPPQVVGRSGARGGTYPPARGARPRHRDTARTHDRSCAGSPTCASVQSITPTSRSSRTSRLLRRGRRGPAPSTATGSRNVANASCIAATACHGSSGTTSAVARRAEHVEVSRRARDASTSASRGVVAATRSATARRSPAIATDRAPPPRRRRGRR